MILIPFLFSRFTTSTEKAYSDMTGEQVTEQSMDTALNELVLTGDLADTVGDSEKAEELIAYLKQEVVGKDISLFSRFTTSTEDRARVPILSADT